MRFFLPALILSCTVAFSQSPEIKNEIKFIREEYKKINSLPADTLRAGDCLFWHSNKNVCKVVQQHIEKGNREFYFRSSKPHDLFFVFEAGKDPKGADARRYYFRGEQLIWYLGPWNVPVHKDSSEFLEAGLRLPIEAVGFLIQRESFFVMKEYEKKLALISGAESLADSILGLKLPPIRSGPSMDEQLDSLGYYEISEEYRHKGVLLAWRYGSGADHGFVDSMTFLRNGIPVLTVVESGFWQFSGIEGEEEPGTLDGDQVDMIYYEQGRPLLRIRKRKVYHNHPRLGFSFTHEFPEEWEPLR